MTFAERELLLLLAYKMRNELQHTRNYFRDGLLEAKKSDFMGYRKEFLLAEADHSEKELAGFEKALIRVEREGNEKT